MTMTATDRSDYPNNRYCKLAQQVSLMRWILPPALALFVLIFEFSEHTVVHNSPLESDFYLELLFFGLIGPILVGAVLSWIVHDLHELRHAYQAIHSLNAELEHKVAVRTEELARANAELRELDRLKSEFVSLVSHELRAPLTNIQGGLELVLSNNAVCPAVENNLIIIQSEVRRLIRLVQQILDVSVMESGQLALNLGPIALRPLLRQIVNQFALTHTEHPITLDMPSRMQLVIADEERLTDILTNLLQNAIKYSPDGGPIQIQLRFDDDFAYISVRDYGVGIAPDDIPYVTKKFYRGCMKHHSNGYGLGLYFANELIKAQGGRLTIKSEGIPGKGTTFTFTLPLEKETLYERDLAY